MRSQIDRTNQNIVEEALVTLLILKAAGEGALQRVIGGIPVGEAVRQRIFQASGGENSFSRTFMMGEYIIGRMGFRIVETDASSALPTLRGHLGHETMGNQGGFDFGFLSLFGDGQKIQLHTAAAQTLQCETR